MLNIPIIVQLLRPIFGLFSKPTELPPRPVIPYDENGSPVLPVDEDDNPFIPLDDDGRPVLPYDDQG